MFSSVCLLVLSLTLREGEKISVAGLLPNTLKKLKGERLGLPSASMVLAKQIGLGATAPRRQACSSAVFIWPGMICNIGSGWFNDEYIYYTKIGRAHF